MQKSLRATPSTTTFIVEHGGGGQEAEKAKVESGRKSTQSLKSSRSGVAGKKTGGRKAVQPGGLEMGKRSEANIHGRKNRQVDSGGKGWGRPESGMKVERTEKATAPAPARDERNHRVVYVNKGMKKSETISIAIHMPKDRPAILGARAAQKKTPTEAVEPPKEILETASSFRLEKTHPVNWDVNSDASSSTFVVEPAKPVAPKRGKDTRGEDTPDREEKKEERKKRRRTKTERRRNRVCFKIYKRCMPKNLCCRWRRTSQASTEEERTMLRRRRLSSEVGKRTSEPWMKKEFVWRSQQQCGQRDGGKSVLSVNSSLGHMNLDDLEDFACWERVPSGGMTCPWEGFLYQLKKSWSVLSVAAFRKNRLSDTPGEILQMIKDGNGFNQRRSPRDNGVPESPREDLAPSSPFDVEPSIFQKNIDIRNWVDALRFYASRPEEERSSAASQAEEMN